MSFAKRPLRWICLVPVAPSTGHRSTSPLAGIPTWAETVVAGGCSSRPATGLQSKSPVSTGAKQRGPAPWRIPRLEEPMGISGQNDGGKRSALSALASRFGDALSMGEAVRQAHGHDESYHPAA